MQPTLTAAAIADFPDSWTSGGLRGGACYRPPLALSIYLVGESPETNARLATTLQRDARLKVVATARAEPEAVQWLTQRHNDADLVIVDLFLKTGSGLGVLRRCEAPQHGRDVVVLSNFAGYHLRRACIALGAAQVFDKSTEFDSLLAYCQNRASRLALH